MQPLALCLDPFAPASASVVEKNLRSMRSSAGKDERDKAKREANRHRLLDSMLEGEDIPLDGVYPGLGERWSRPRDEQSAVLIPAASFQRLADKIVRGTVYWLDQRFIEPPYSVNFYAVEDENAGEVRDLLKRAGKTYSQGPGITVTRAVVPEDGPSSVLQIELWGGQVKMFAVVSQDA